MYALLVAIQSGTRVENATNSSAYTLSPWPFQRHQTPASQEEERLNGSPLKVRMFLCLSFHPSTTKHFDMFRCSHPTAFAIPPPYKTIYFFGFGYFASICTHRHDISVLSTKTLHSEISTRTSDASSPANSRMLRLFSIKRDNLLGSLQYRTRPV